MSYARSPRYSSRMPSGTNCRSVMSLSSALGPTPDGSEQCGHRPPPPREGLGRGSDQPYWPQTVYLSDPPPAFGPPPRKGGGAWGLIPPARRPGLRAWRRPGGHRLAQLAVQQRQRLAAPAVPSAGDAIMPHSTGRPTSTAARPRASASRRRGRPRTPESSSTGHLAAHLLDDGGQRVHGGDPRSSWRPPWLETTTRRAPRTARGRRPPQHALEQDGSATRRTPLQVRPRHPAFGKTASTGQPVAERLLLRAAVGRRPRRGSSSARLGRAARSGEAVAHVARRAGRGPAGRTSPRSAVAGGRRPAHEVTGQAPVAQDVELEQRGPSLAAATASIEHEANVDRQNSARRPAAARADATSPSGWASLCRLCGRDADRRRQVVAEQASAPSAAPRPPAGRAAQPPAPERGLVVSSAISSPAPPSMYRTPSFCLALGRRPQVGDAQRLRHLATRAGAPLRCRSPRTKRVERGDVASTAASRGSRRRRSARRVTVLTMVRITGWRR